MQTASENRSFGAQGMAGRLRRVLVNRPGPKFGAGFETAGAFYEQPIDLPLAQIQHDGLVALLRDSGVVVEHVGEEAGVDSIYTYDPAIVTDGGAILLRSSKVVRQKEPAAHGRSFERLGIPIIHTLNGDAYGDGGDLLWLDSQTLVIGRTFRTNAEGARQIAEAARPFVRDIHIVDLPVNTGRDECLHTLSLISMIDRDLAVVSTTLMPVYLHELLGERGVQLVEIDPGEWDSLAPNVLAVGPRDAIMLEGNPKTASALRAAGSAVREFSGSDVAVKGSGGPTCLTLPLLRDPI